MMFPRLGLINKSQKGFTLIELVLVIAIGGVISGAVMTTIFQVVVGSAHTNNHMIAVSQVQNAGYWVSYHAHMAQADPIIGDDPATSGVTEFLTLTWTHWDDGDVHRVVYALEDMPSGSLKNLQGIHYINGVESDRTPEFKYIDPDPGKTNCEFTNGALVFTITATVGRQSETRVYEIVPRPGS